MTFGAVSKVFVHAFDGLGGTRNINLTGDSEKVALFNDTTTPSNTVSAATSAYNTGVWVTGNEVTATGWAAGGVAAAGQSFTAASNVLKFDHRERVRLPLLLDDCLVAREPRHLVPQLRWLRSGRVERPVHDRMERVRSVHDHRHLTC
jgi:hypothetical protein